MGIIIRQSFKSSIISWVGMGIGILTQLFVSTKYLTSSEIGVSRVFFEIANILALISTLGIIGGIARYYPYFNSKNSKNGFLFWAFIIPIVGCILVLGCMFVFDNQFFNFFNRRSSVINQYYWYLIPQFILLTFCMVTDQLMAINGRTVIGNLTREIFQRIGVLLLLIGYILHWYAFKYNIILLPIVQLFCLLINIYYVLKFFKIKEFKPNVQYLKQNPNIMADFYSYFLFLVLGTISTQILSRMDLLMVGAKSSMADAGVYSIAFLIGTFINIPLRTMVQIGFPIIAQKMSMLQFDEVKKLYQSSSINSFLASLFLFGLIWINIDFIFDIIPNGNKYIAGKWVILIIGLSKIIESLNAFAGGILSYSKHYFGLLFTSLLSVVLQFFLTKYLIPLFGIEGAAIATLISFSINSIGIALLVYYFYKFQPLDIKLIPVIIFCIIYIISCYYIDLQNYNFILCIIKSIGFILGMSFIVIRFKISTEAISLYHVFKDKYLKKP